MEFGSAALSEIAGLYAAPNETAFTGKAKGLSEKFALLEGRLATGPYFDDDRFSLVDALFGPVFRYFDVFDRIGEFGILSSKTKVISGVKRWRGRLRFWPP
jgi:glutathione S-transferase